MYGFVCSFPSRSLLTLCTFIFASRLLSPSCCTYCLRTRYTISVIALCCVMRFVLNYVFVCFVFVSALVFFSLVMRFCFCICLSRHFCFVFYSLIMCFRSCAVMCFILCMVLVSRPAPLIIFSLFTLFCVCYPYFKVFVLHLSLFAHIRGSSPTHEFSHTCITHLSYSLSVYIIIVHPSSESESWSEVFK